MALQQTRKANGKKSRLPSYDVSFESFRTQALMIPTERVLPFRADVNVVVANIKKGVESLFGPHGDAERGARVSALQEALPKLDLKKVLELTDLGRALVAAAERVAAPLVVEINQKLEIVRNLREPLLRTAIVLAGKGLLPKNEVIALQSGTDKIGLANDGVELATMFQANAAKIHGMHPFTPKELSTLRATSEWILERLSPERTSVTRAKRTPAEDLCDRLWTMIVERHSDLRVIAYYQHRDDFESRAPKLAP